MYNTRSISCILQRALAFNTAWGIGLEKNVSSLLQTALVSSRGVWKVLAILALCLLVGTVGGAILAFLAPAYTAALVIALAGGILMLRDTQWGFVALIGVICLLPFAAVPLNMGFEPTFLDLMLLTLIFVWASRIATRRQGPFIASPLAVPLVTFLVVIVAAFIAGLGHSRISTTLLRRFAELILGISTFFVVINCIRTRRHLEQVTTVIILAGFAASLIGIVLYFLPANLAVRLLSTLRYVRYPAGTGVLRYIEDNPELPLRAISTSQDPNVLGGLLILVTGLTIPQILSPRPLISRKLVVPMIISMIFCLILTYSRAAMGGLAVGVATIAILRYRRLGWFLLAGVVLMLILPQTQAYLQHFVEGVRGEDLATQMRFGEYRDAVTIILRHPWLGVGFSSTPEINLYVGVSCVYLLIAEETGLIGLAIFLLIMILLFVHMWRGARHARGEPRLEAILWGIWAALLGALAGGLLDHYFFNLDFAHAVTIFWIYAGLGMVASSLAWTSESAALPVKTPSGAENRKLT